MPNKYFKPHETLDLNSHKYDVGVLIGLKDGYEDNLFIKKVLELPELEYEPYYLYHLDYFLSKGPQGEQEFFSFVWQIVLRLNSYLKEIADMCNISKPLTFHIARHTFATTVTLTNGVPIETVSKLLGHSKLTTTQIYAKVVESKINDDMALLKTKLM